MVIVADPSIFLTDPQIRNPQLWMPTKYGSELDIFEVIEKDIVKKVVNYI
jgi:hypothetical protein